MVKIDEPINVWVFFKGRNIEPVIFFWRGRKIKVDRINLVHTSNSDTSVFYHFSVSSGDNFYRLGFDSKSFKWRLEQVEEEG